MRLFLSDSTGPTYFVFRASGFPLFTRLPCLSLFLFKLFFIHHKKYFLLFTHVHTLPIYFYLLLPRYFSSTQSANCFSIIFREREGERGRIFFRFKLFCVWYYFCTIKFILSQYYFVFIVSLIKEIVQRAHERDKYIHTSLSSLFYFARKSIRAFLWKENTFLFWNEIFLGKMGLSFTPTFFLRFSEASDFSSTALDSLAKHNNGRD